MSFNFDSETYNEDSKEKSQSFVSNYFIQPFISGILGFISFFIVLISSKYLGYLVGSTKTFQIDFKDALLSLLGFVLVFLIRFLENFNEKSL